MIFITAPLLVSIAISATTPQSSGILSMDAHGGQLVLLVVLCSLTRKGLALTR